MEKLRDAMKGGKEDTNSQQREAFDAKTGTLLDTATSHGTVAQTTGRPQALYERLTWFSIVAEKSLGVTPQHDNLLNEQALSQLELPELVNTATRTFAKYQDRQVWIEWKRYEEVMKSGERGEVKLVPEDKTQRSVERLISLLRVNHRPSEFRVPTCNGYFLHQDKHPWFGVIYEFDDQKENASIPQTLWEVLSGPKPPLHSRVALAQEVASCLMYLHAVNWLHKGIRSSNILFQSLEGEVLGKMYISGLEYARPDEAGLTVKKIDGDLTWAEYVHPDYLGPGELSGYRKTYDIYSLGLVLLEIAHWKPLKEILGINLVSGQRDENLRLLQGIRERIFDDEGNVLTDVNRTLGARYLCVVKTCLIGMDAFGLSDRLPQNDRAVAALLQQAYVRLVVDVLKGIVV